MIPRSHTQSGGGSFCARICQACTAASTNMHPTIIMPITVRPSPNPLIGGLDMTQTTKAARMTKPVKSLFNMKKTLHIFSNFVNMSTACRKFCQVFLQLSHVSKLEEDFRNWQHWSNLRQYVNCRHFLKVYER